MSIGNCKTELSVVRNCKIEKKLYVCVEQCKKCKNIKCSPESLMKYT